MNTTITEGLAEIKTISKRLEKKRLFIIDNLFLQGNLRDPLEKQGGSETAIKEARQSIDDLEKRIIRIRSAINQANTQNTITVNGESKTIAEWIIWRREIAPHSRSFLNNLNQNIQSVRQQAAQKGMTVTHEADNPTEVTIFLDEKALAAEIEGLEAILGELDGQLSLKNATILIEI